MTNPSTSVLNDLRSQIVEEFTARRAQDRASADRGIFIWTRDKLPSALRMQIHDAIEHVHGGEVPMQFHATSDLPDNAWFRITFVGELDHPATQTWRGPTDPAWDREARVLSITTLGTPGSFDTVIMPTAGETEWQPVPSPGRHQHSYLQYQLTPTIPEGTDHRLRLRRSAQAGRLQITAEGRDLGGPDGSADYLLPDRAIVHIEIDDGQQHRTIALSMVPIRDFQLPPGTMSPLQQEYIDIDFPGIGQVTVRSPEISGGTLKQFAVPDDDLKTNVFLAAVLSAEGRSIDGSRWHVKLYRTATKAHTAALTDLLGRQIAHLAAAGSEFLPMVHLAGAIDPHSDDSSPRGAGVAQPPLYDQGLSRWFGIAPSGDLSAFTAVASRHLTTIPWHQDSGRGLVIHTATRYAGLAAALDLLHSTGSVHGDLKADNVCVRPDLPGQPFVLIDSDAVALIKQSQDYLRGTLFTCSPNFRRGAPDADPHLLRTNERYSFVLLVLRTLLDAQEFSRLAPDRTGARPIEDLQFVVDTLTHRWSPAASHQIDVIRYGLDERVWRDDDASLAHWLTNLVAQPPAPHRPPTSPPTTAPTDVRAAQHAPPPAQLLAQQLKPEFRTLADGLLQKTRGANRGQLQRIVLDELTKQTQNLTYDSWRKHYYRYATAIIVTAIIVLIAYTAGVFLI
ncbi:hypothetical protein [Gordonia alkaliphila]|uniref:Protein kinase domain-containing protein n=1 Tax=Gordonia alkaliphila TaxID=1053547 RepID=A0ABP8YVP9_9ACTN